MSRSIYLLGIDLSLPVGGVATGMRNIILDQFIDDDSIEVDLIVTETALKSLRRSNPNVLASHFNMVHVDDARRKQSNYDAILHPFNQVNNDLSGAAINILFYWDLTPYTCKFEGWESALPDMARHLYAADRIVTATEFVKGQLMELFSFDDQQIDVARLKAFDFDVSPTCSIKEKSGPKQIIYPAAVRPHKNHRVLLEAIRDIEGVKLLCTTGELHGEKNVHELQSFAEQIGVADKFRFEFGASREGYINLLMASDCLCSPSLSEGFGIPPLEAMALGVPVIASNRSCTPEILGDAAYYFDPSSAPSIASALKTVLADSDLRDELKARGSIHARAFSKVDAALGLPATILRLLDNGDRPKNVSSLRALGAELSVAKGIEFVGLEGATKCLESAGRYSDAEIVYQYMKIEDDHWHEHGRTLERADRGVSKPSPDFDREGAPEMMLLLDVTRLFDGNVKSGISRYIIRLIQELQKRKTIKLVPFYDPTARGYRSNGTYRVREFMYEDFFLEVFPRIFAEGIMAGYDGDVCYHSPFHPLPTARLNQVAYCVTVCDVLHLTHPFYYPKGANFITADIIDSITSGDSCIVISSHTGVELASISSASHIQYAPLASFFASKIPDRDDKCLDVAVPFQGDARKRSEFMLEVAFAHLNNTKSGKIHCFGKLSRMQADMRAHLEKDQRVILYDEPNDSTVEDIFQKSKAFLYLSDLEGFGMPPLEAAALGCLPVVTSASSMAEIYKGYDYTVSPESPAIEIAKVLSEVDKLSIDERRSKCVRLAGRYSWELTAACHVAAYAAAIERNKVLVRGS